MFSNQNRNRGGATSVRTPLSLRGDAIPKLRTEFKKAMDSIAKLSSIILRENDKELQKLEGLLKGDTISKSEFQKIYRRRDNLTTSYYCYDNVLENMTAEAISSSLVDVRKYAQRIDAELNEIAEEFDL